MSLFQRILVICLLVSTLSLVYLAWDRGAERRVQALVRKAIARIAEDDRLWREAKCRFSVLEATAFYRMNIDGDLPERTVRIVALKRLRAGCGGAAEIEDYPEITAAE